MVLEELHLAGFNQDLGAEEKVVAVGGKSFLDVLQGLFLTFNGLKILEKNLIPVVYVRVQVGECLFLILNYIILEFHG